jgi:hypothetical protein
MKTSNDPGIKPELKWIAVDKLYVDPEYQREAASKASKRNIEYMRLNFSWAFCGALVVCYVKEKKQYAIIDGQHRYLVAKSLTAIDELPCIVISSLDIKRQAKSFVAINTKRVILNSLASFHAAVASDDPTACAVKKLLDDCKIEAPRTPVGTETGPRQTHAIGTIAKMIGKYTDDQIRWVLNVIPEAFGQKKGMLRASMLKALADFVKANPDVERPRFVKVLASMDPYQLETDARAYVSIKGGTTHAAMVQAIERYYKMAGRKSAA